MSVRDREQGGGQGTRGGCRPRLHQDSTAVREQGDDSEREPTTRPWRLANQLAGKGGVGAPGSWRRDVGGRHLLSFSKSPATPSGRGVSRLPSVAVSGSVAWTRQGPTGTSNLPGREETWLGPFSRRTAARTNRARVPEPSPVCDPYPPTTFPHGPENNRIMVPCSLAPSLSPYQDGSRKQTRGEGGGVHYFAVCPSVPRRRFSLGIGGQREENPPLLPPAVLCRLCLLKGVRSTFFFFAPAASLHPECQHGISRPPWRFCAGDRGEGELCTRALCLVQGRPW